MWVFSSVFLFVIFCIVLFFIGYITICVRYLTHNEWSVLSIMSKFKTLMCITFLITLLIAAGFGIYIVIYNFMHPELTRMQVAIYGIKKIWWNYLLMAVSYYIGFVYEDKNS